MKSEPSELEMFLRGQAASGEVQETESTFTLAREKALQKIAEFQLPFSNAWVVKLVQCAVAGGSGSPIRIDLHSNELRAYFEAPELTLDILEERFFDPEPHQSAHVRHIISALWAMGLKEKCAFQLVFPKSDEALRWDGEMLHRVETMERLSCLMLTVVLQPETTGALNWIKKIASSGTRRAELIETIYKRCYTCPVPLCVDGRRADSLYRCPTHGQTHQDFPLAVGFATAELPPLPVPPGTYEEYPKRPHPNAIAVTNNSDSTGDGISSISKHTFENLERVGKAPAPFILTAHLEWSRSGDAYRWEERPTLPRVYWVQDGVVVDQQPITNRYVSCSCAVFLNADGLNTDLTSFHLADSEERTSRVRAATRAVLSSLGQLPLLENGFEESITSHRRRTRIWGGGLFVLGVATLWALPVAGVGMLATSGAFYGLAGSTQVSKVTDLKRNIFFLQSALEDSFHIDPVE